MLSSLKGLLNVGKPTTPASEQQPNINVNAGAEILSHYQQNWAEIHDLNENNASCAERLAEKINNLHVAVAKKHSDATQIVQLLSSTPSLKDNVENCVTTLTNLYESFEKVERALLNLENLIEDVELKKKKIENRYQLALYKEKRIANLEETRQKLAAKHTQKILEHDSKQKQVLQERQQVFQEAFHYDLETYRTSGELPKIEIPTPQQPSALLEEIQLDLDKKELDQFLEGT